MAEEIIFKSKFPSIDVPETNLPEFVLRQMSAFGSKKALIDGNDGSSLTFDQIIGLVRKVARGLLDAGLQKGDVFCIFCPNIIYYPVIFHGVLLAGGCVTTANPLYTAEELEHQLTDSRAKFMITIPLFIEKAKEAMKAAKLSEDNLYVFGDVAGVKPFSSLTLNNGEVPPLTVDVKKDYAVLPYSSGTTGMPKGVCLSHYNLVANLHQFKPLESVHFTQDEVLVGVLPFFHIYGMVAVLNLGMVSGVTTVVMGRFDMERFLQLVQEHKISWAHLVPPIVLGLAKHPIVAKYDISSLRSLASAAAPLGKQLQEELSQKLKINIRQGYGMTELSPVTHIVPHNDNKFGSVGLLVPNCEVKIIDVDTNQCVGVGKPGEICIRGPNVMLGYLHNPKATADTIDSEGFIHTGDIGLVDEDGYYYIVDRLKELIKYNGYQVPPAELEALLVTHESVADAAVIGVPDDEAGELPKAFIVLRPGKTVTGEELSKWLEQHIAPYKKLRGGVEFVDAIPKSASGKILRRLLKEKLLKAK